MPSPDLVKAHWQNCWCSCSQLYACIFLWQGQVISIWWWDPVKPNHFEKDGWDSKALLSTCRTSLVIPCELCATTHEPSPPFKTQIFIIIIPSSVSCIPNVINQKRSRTYHNCKINNAYRHNYMFFYIDRKNCPGKWWDWLENDRGIGLIGINSTKIVKSSHG